VIESTWNEAGLQHMRELMSGYVERGEVPSMVFALSRGNQVHVEALGARSAGGNDPVRRDTIFRIASMTKPITALATMLLVQDGKLKLEEPVDALLPELSGRRVLVRAEGPLAETVPAARPITPRDLLTFCFGIGQMLPDGPLAQAASELKIGMGPPEPGVTPAPDEWMRRLGSLPLAYQPGARWQYHLGSEVLGVLIARASGQSFEAFMRERIFEPLGMRDTSFGVPREKLDRFTDSYRVDPQSGRLALFDAADGGQWSRPPAFPSGGGGLCSTIDDYLAFSRSMLNGGALGNTRLLSRASVEMMTTDQLTPAQKQGAILYPGFFDRNGWGFGMSVVTRSDDLSAPIGMFGWDGGLGSSWRAIPSKDVTKLILTNRMFTSPVPPDYLRDFWRRERARSRVSLEVRYAATWAVA
jgi:CubicO group peptidase (beta-lactamase class C family)